MIIAALPARWLARVVGDPIRARHLNILVSCGVLLLWLSAGFPLVPGHCLVRLLLNVPCPFCGVTHATLAALHGEWAQAMRLNAGGITVAAVLLAQLPLRLGALLGAWTFSYARDERAERAINALVISTCVVSAVVRVVAS